jgi:hypothetical protein
LFETLFPPLVFHILFAAVLPQIPVPQIDISPFETITNPGGGSDTSKSPTICQLTVNFG